jgi:hypothetical protein
MLLFLLHDHFHELPGPAPRFILKSRDSRADARAMLGAGLFVIVWCTLRLLAASGDGPSFDIGLAVACWCVGVGAALHGIRGLRG